MKTKTFLLPALVFSFCSVSCKLQIDREKNYPLEITDNIMKVEEIPWGYHYFIKEPEVVQSWPCQKRYTVNKEGRLMMFYLSEDYIINGDLIPAGTKIRLYSLNSPLSYGLTRETEIQGYLVSTEKPLSGLGIHVSFYENGNIEWFRPENEITINGIPCKAQKCVRVYSDGLLHVCTLLKDFQYEGITYKEGTVLILNKERKPSKISGNYLRDNNYIEFYENGNPKEVVIGSDTEIQGIPCTGWHKKPLVTFYPEGRLRTCYLSRDFEIEGKLFRKRTEIYYNLDCQCYEKSPDNTSQN